MTNPFLAVFLIFMVLFTSLEKASADRLTKYRELLGVSATADQKEIKGAYRRMANRLHPDKYQQKHGHLSEAERTKLEERFKQVKEAYEVLMKDLNPTQSKFSSHRNDSSELSYADLMVRYSADMMYLQLQLNTAENFFDIKMHTKIDPIDAILYNTNLIHKLNKILSSPIVSEEADLQRVGYSVLLSAALANLGLVHLADKLHTSQSRKLNREYMRESYAMLMNKSKSLNFSIEDITDTQILDFLNRVNADYVKSIFERCTNSVASGIVQREFLVELANFNKRNNKLLTYIAESPYKHIYLKSFLDMVSVQSDEKRTLEILDLFLAW